MIYRIFIINLLDVVFILYIYCVNLENFKLKSVADAQVIGGCELTDYNTYDNQNNVVFRPIKVKVSGHKIKAQLPKYSYTVITVRK